MDREAWWASGHRVMKEADTAECLTLTHFSCSKIMADFSVWVVAPL